MPSRPLRTPSAPPSYSSSPLPAPTSHTSHPPTTPRTPHDRRIPSPTQLIDSIYLISPDGFKEHYMTLLHRFPEQLDALMEESRRLRWGRGKGKGKERDEGGNEWGKGGDRGGGKGKERNEGGNGEKGIGGWPEDVVERAMERGVLRWWSDGPRGGIWILHPQNLELLTILVEEMEFLRLRREAGGQATGAVGDMHGWEVLGKGRKGSEGFVYLLHPCGRGGVEEKVEEKEEKRVGRGKEVGKGGKEVGKGGMGKEGRGVKDWRKEYGIQRESAEEMREGLEREFRERGGKKLGIREFLAAKKRKG